MVRIDIVIFDGVDELDVVGPFEVLRNARRLGAQIDVQLVALQELDVTANHGLAFRAESVLNGPAQVLLIPGGGWVDRAQRGIRYEIERGELPRRIAEAHKRGTVIAAVCTGAMAVAASGIAAGRKMVTHHCAVEDLRSLGVEILNQRFVDDGDIISSGGVTSGIDLALHLVTRFADAGLSRAVSQQIEYPVH